MNTTENGLRPARLRAELSLEEAALRLRITPERLARWENGEEIPGTDSLFELSVIYGVPPHRLLLSLGEKSGGGDFLPDATVPALDDFRRELLAMRDVELLPLDDETIEYCVGALRARLDQQKPQSK
ncbi:helix-turn-helix domain-containing protein [Hwanghaeella sp.]|uniref:helix-turn-helix domain-containing protein n=1 Tax=Hwanghaeella sp. TaxID=2605943 RepID=UPI003CCB9C81